MAISIDVITLFVLSLCLLTSAESNIKSSSSKKHEHFMPLVAFQCGYRNKFMNANSRWQDDPSSAAGCLHGKYDILKYCKRVYPNEEITNIVEYTHLTRVEHWCKEDGTDCHHQFTMRPFRCIAGEFVTESLQVPQRCHFSHIAGKDKCNDFKFWNKRADDQCNLKKETNSKQPMKLRSFAILEPCGLDMFRGVEFVCCPKDLEERIEKVVNLETADKSSKMETDNNGDDEEDQTDDEEDDEEYSEDQEKSFKKEQKDGLDNQDPYFKDDPATNEHERFQEAEERLEKKHRRKVTKVITEWSELFERYNKVKEKDPKGAEQYKREMTSKFRKTVASLETENREQRKQIEELHDERVQTALNEKKRQATHEYRAALAVQVGQMNKKNVLRTLKNYIRAEEKDRQHMLNRYRHLLRSDPEAAISFEPVLLHRLRYIDLRINGTLAMLRDFPELEKQIRPVAITFWKDYRKENTPEALDDEQVGNDNKKEHFLSDEEQNERLIRLYKQNFERKHSSTHLTLQLQEAVKTRLGSDIHMEATTTAAITSKKESMTKKSMVIALKDVLKEDLAQQKKSKEQPKQLAEDSDEDQFEEDEDDEISDKTTAMPIPTTTKEHIAIHVELLNKEGQSKANKGKEVKELKKEKDKKLAKLINSKTTSIESHEEEEETDEDEDLASDAESEYIASNDKKNIEDEDDAKRKHLRINVEPILLAPSPNELAASEIESPIAYAKHHRSFSHHRTQDDENVSILGRWLAQTNLLLGMVALIFAALAIIILLRRRRNRHPGFIEVDVCTPEESHLAGIQVNGYENPTYSFFEGKQSC